MTCEYTGPEYRRHEIWFQNVELVINFNFSSVIHMPMWLMISIV